MTRKRGKIKSKQRSESSQKSDDELLYCICRSSDGTRFMIACDNCEEWYHGDCINVTPKQANNIKRFYCHLCIGRNPSLEIEYKTIKETRPRLPGLRQQIKKINFSDDENDADLSSTSTPDKSFPNGRSKKSMRKRPRNSLPEIIKSPTPTQNITAKKRRGRPRERPDDYDAEATEDEMETSGIAPTLNDCTPLGLDEPNEQIIYNYHNSKQFRRQNNSTSINNNYLIDQRKSCGICNACKTQTDCGKCDLCIKYNSGLCRKRVCLRNPINPRASMNQCTKDYPILDEEIDEVFNDQNFNRTSAIQSRQDIRHRMINPNTVKNSAAVGSKMRRGDHLPGGGGNTSNRRMNAVVMNSIGANNTSSNLKFIQDADDVNLGDLVTANGTGLNSTSIPLVSSTTYHHRYQNPTSTRLSRNQSNNSVPNRRLHNQTQSTDSNIILSTNSTPIQSSHHFDESDEDVMVAPELMSPTRRQLDELQYQRINNRNTVNIETTKIEYGLNYPDHLYCKHHRSFNWHGNNDVNESMVDLHTESPLKSDEKQIDQSISSSIDDLSPTSNAYMILERQPCKPNTKLLTNNNLQKSSCVSGGSSFVTSVSSASTFMKSVSNVIHDNDHVNTTIATTASNLPSDGHNNVYLFESTSSPPIQNSNHHQHISHQQHNHHHHHHISSHQTAYPIVDLNQNLTSSHEISRVSSSGSSSQHQQLLDTTSQDNQEIPQHQTSILPLSSSATHLATNSIFSKVTSVNTTQNQEFYTINDDDSLEINWPKETVNV